MPLYDPSKNYNLKVTISPYGYHRSYYFHICVNTTNNSIYLNDLSGNWREILRLILDKLDYDEIRMDTKLCVLRKNIDEDTEKIINMFKYAGGKSGITVKQVQDMYDKSLNDIINLIKPKMVEKKMEK